MPGSLYYGDNLQVLREHVPDGSVDLVYLDPPFNSNASYNVLFKAPSGHQSQAQIEAFEDTWHWGTEAEAAFTDALRNARYPDVGLMLEAMRRFLRENDMLAYLAMMAARVIELHRVLKRTGSLYLHCDPTASHYLKVLLDAVFGPDNFQGEVTWQRTNSRSTTGRWPRLHDTLLFFSKSDKFTFYPQQAFVGEAKLPHTLITGADGKKYQTFELTAPGATKEGDSGKPWRGFDPSDMRRHWANAHSIMDAWDDVGLIHWPPRGGFPRRRAAEPFDPAERFVTVGDVWTDIDRINQTAKERIGYPTQKPLALLERIIKASSNEGNTVLDPFCGCGTAVHAAEKLGRNWIGIDITHLAVSLIERRLNDAFPGVKFDVHGTPKDLDGARDLANRDKYQFQWWAVSLVDAVPYGGKKRGADSGIDGWRYMATGRNTVSRCIVSVKGGDNVNVQMIRDLRGVIEREKVEAGMFITLAEPTAPMTAEAAKAGFFDSPFGNKRHQRLQIMTIEALLRGAKPDLPPLAIEAGFRKAEKEDRAKRDQTTLLANMDAPVAAAVRNRGTSQPRRTR